MLSAGMECALFFTTDCTAWEWLPRSKYRRGNDNTPKKLDYWMDLTNMNAGDRESSEWGPLSYICRSFFNNLLQPDSSANNKHVPNDGWHDATEDQYKNWPKGP